MAKTSTLHDAFLEELKDIYHGEKQLTKALPRMAKAAGAAPLADAFETHLQETLGQIERLEQVFESLGEPARGKTCEGMAGLLEEGKAIMGEDFDESVMDAALIAAAQRVEHYEIAAYGTLVAWAEAMGHRKAAKLLQRTLDEEKATDEKLNSLAMGGINESAAEGAHEGEDDEEEVEVMPSRRGGRARAGSNR
jgi:ferritin-like metal-binding protein YciE